MSTSSYLKTYSKYIAFKGLALSIIFLMAFFLFRLGNNKNLDLGREAIYGLHLMDKADTKLIENTFGKITRITSEEDNTIYEISNDSSIVGITQNRGGETTRIFIQNPGSSEYKTGKGINLHSSFTDIVNAYGRNYTREYNGTSQDRTPGYSIIYSDKKNQISLRFSFSNITSNEILNSIELSKVH